MHYGTVVIPTRPRRPRDKAKAEAAVQAVEREMMAPLRKRRFFSLAEIQAALREQLTRLNYRPFRKLEGSRRSLYESMDRPCLKPLPPLPYKLAEWRKARVNIDYHIEVERNLYSVPCHLVHEQVDVRLTSRVLEVLSSRSRITHRYLTLCTWLLAQLQYREPSIHALLVASDKRRHANASETRVIS